MHFAGAIRYPEGDGASDPQLDKAKITREPLRSLLVDLRTQARNLSFKRSTTEEALRLVHEGRLVVRTACRIRHACRHASQGLLRKPVPSWVRQVFGNEEPLEEACREGVKEEEEDEEEQEDTEKGEPAEVVDEEKAANMYEFGFDSATSSAWRSKATRLRGKQRREITYDVFSKDTDRDDDGAWARFPDGLEVQLHPEQVSKADLAKKAVSKQMPSAMAWESEHHETKDRLWVTRRKDRLGIAVLLMGEKSKQICMCSTKSFHDDIEEDRYIKAVRVMTEVGRKFSQGEIQLDSIYKHRDQCLKDLFSTGGKAKAAMKRPARALATTPPKASASMASDARGLDEQPSKKQVSASVASGASGSDQQPPLVDTSPAESKALEQDDEDDLFFDLPDDAFFEC